VTDEGHHLRFGLRAERLDAPGDPRANFVDAGVAGTEPTGWVVRMSGEDSWTLSAPISFVYGLGLDRSLDATEPALLVPRAGWVWSSDGLRLRMIVSYHTFAGGSAEGTKLAQLEAFRSDSPVGYDTQFETALPWGFRLKGGIMSAPVVYQEIGLGQGMVALASPALLPLIESSAAVERSRLALERQTARVNTSLQWAAGKIEGVSAQLLPLDVPVTVFGEQSLEYRSGRIGVRFLATGTDLAAEFVSLRDLTPGDTSDSAAQNYVELRIAQDLIRLPGWGGSCRLLVTARTTGRGESDDRSIADGDTADMLAAMNQRLSAGLSVAF
jgi:hypothetical protein